MALPTQKRTRSTGLSLRTLLASLSVVSAKLASTGLSVKLNDVDYFISPFSSGKVKTPTKAALSNVPSVVGFKPVTVIQDLVSQSEVSALLSNWTTIDDVFQTAFADAIFLADGTGGNVPRCPTVTKRDVFGRGSSASIISMQNSTIPSGPYFLEVATGEMYPVYRLYEDFAGAFLEPVIPTPDGTFQPLSAKIAGAASLSVGVPSRLYFTKTAEKPLAGVRLGVKDIYRIAGMKGSNGNRAWYNFYPASTSTGPAIQRLIDAGAQIVGLQKTSQFANGETATSDWVDYHSPFNPRGDGYQDPSSSSSGAGASIGSYDWLDIAIGSDTGGSIRGPAGVQGLFGNRPSHGLVSLDNVMPLAPTLDTAGFLVRDPKLWDAAQAALYGTNYTSYANKKPIYPKKIYTMGFPTSASTPANKMLLDFASALAKFVGGNVTVLNINNEWAASKPAEAGSVTLSEMLNTTYPTLIAKEQTPLVRDPFYVDYAAAHGGRLPFINPVPIKRWAYGDSLPASALDAAYTAKSIFMKWFQTYITPASTSDDATCSSTIVLYVGSSGGQNPRNRYSSGPSVPFGFSSSRISVFTEVPDVVFPLGEVGSVSSITGVEEKFPVAVDVMAAKGCDGLLARLAGELVDAGVINVPKPGGTLAGGEVLQ